MAKPNLTRRNFIKNSSTGTIGAFFINDAIYNLFENLFSDFGFDLKNGFDSAVAFTSPANFIKVHLYFLNLKINKGKLEKIHYSKNQRKEAYMLVRMPQQHIAEAIFDLNIIAELLPTDIAETFVSGYSFLAFRFKADEKKYDLDAKFLLDFSNFHLLTYHDISNDQISKLPISIRSSNQYPIQANHQIKALSTLVHTSGNPRLMPITLIEMPYKMYLTPAYGDNRTLPSDYFKIAARSGSKALYCIRHRKFWNHSLHELWSTRLENHFWSEEQGIMVEPPSFRVVAYNSEPDKVEGGLVNLLPSASNRAQLANLTNIHEPNRLVRSDYFSVSALGGTTYLRYKNLDPKKEAIVAWDQHIRLARDNYVKITYRAVDVITGLKVLISVISERSIDEKIDSSFLRKRYFVEYLEREKEYEESEFRGFPFVKIRAIDSGKFFKPTPVKSKAYKPVSQLAYAVLQEGFNSLFPEAFIKFSYIGIDHRGQHHEFESPMNVIMAEVFTITSNQPFVIRIKGDRKYVYKKGDAVTFGHIGFLDPNNTEGYEFETKPFTANQKEVYESVKSVNLARLENPEQYDILLPDSRLSYTSKKNNENDLLVTRRLTFYSYHNDDFNEGYPIVPMLLESSVVIPQMEGIEGIPKFRSVTYAHSHLGNKTNDNNPAQMILRTLRENEKWRQKIENNFKSIEFDRTALNDIVGTASKEAFNKAFKNALMPIQDVFGENYKKIGSLINPDIVVEGISLLDQGISLAEYINTKVEDGQELLSVTPADLLRGLDAEIIGGISLKDILQQVLPLDDAPILNIKDEYLQTIDDYQDALDQVAEFLGDIKAEYESIHTRINSIPTEIEQLSETLKEEVKRQLSEEANRILQEQWERLGLYKLFEYVVAYKHIKTHVKKRYDNTKKFLNTIASEIKAFKYDPQYEELKDLLDGEDGLLNWLDDPDNKQGLIKFVEKWLDYQVAQRRTNPDPMIVEQFEQAKEKALVSVNKLLNKFAEVGKFGPRLLEVSKTLISNWILALVESMSIDPLEKAPTLEPIEYLFNQAVNQNKDVYAPYQYSIISSIKTVDRFTPGFEQQYVKQESDFAELNSNSKIDSSTGSSERIQFLIKINTVIEGLLDQFEASRRLVYESKKTIESLNKDSNVGSIVLANSVFDNYFKNIANDLSTIVENVVSEINMEFDNYHDPSQADLWNQIKAALQTIVNRIKADPKKYFLEDRQNIVRELEDLVSRLKDIYLAKLNPRVNEIRQEIEKSKAELAGLNNELKNFKTNLLERLEQKLKEKNKELFELIERGETNVKIIRDEIDKLRKLLAFLKTPQSKDFSYVWSTEKFKDFGNKYVKFYKKSFPNTLMEVEVKSSVKYNLGLSGSPGIQGMEYSSYNRLSNFAIGFFNLVTVHFDSISFSTGSHIKDDFDTRIRNVEFEGVLNFVGAFQDKIKSLNNNLTLDIDALGAILGYTLPLGSLTAGGFNIFNLGLSMEFRLPFQPKLPMQFLVGLNSPRNPFYFNVSIFPGRGYFMLTLEAKRGLVKIELLLEFGAEFYLDIGGVASGHAYLYGGIYFRKTKTDVLLLGYLICSGSFNIINMFSSSLFFDLRLTGTGDYVDGRCTLVVSKRFSKWFKISVRVSMYKKFKGASKQRGNSVKGEGGSTDETLPADTGLLNNGTSTVNGAGEYDILKPNPLETGVSEKQWEEYFSSYYN